MGNNNGRSKGCTTCLRRHVKCDQTRPICTRCSKGSFICLGYREALFVDMREQILQRLEKKASSSDIEPRYMLHSHEGLQPWSPISESAMRDDQFISHLVANFHGPMKIICHYLVAPSYQEDSLQQTARKQSFLALATTFYGVGHARESLMYNGRRHYLRALEMVNATIAESSRSGVLEALSSVVALCLHEAIAPTQSNEHSWLQHIYGIEQLFTIRGPTSKKCDPVGSALLDITRPMMIIAALLARRPSLMARPEWSATNSCPLDDDHKSFPGSGLAYLLDALAQVPSLYHERENLVSDQTTKFPRVSTSEVDSLDPSPAAQALLDRAQSLRDEVSFQMTLWKVSHPGSDFPSIPCTAVLSTQPYPCTVVTHFSSLQVANVFTFYNALLIVIDQFIISIHPLLPLCDVAITSEESRSEHISAAVMEIIKSVDYHLPFTQPSTTSPTGSSGPRNFYLLFPIRVAHQALSRSESPEDTPKKLWLEDVSYIIKCRAGAWMSNGKIFDTKQSNRYQLENS